MQKIEEIGLHIPKVLLPRDGIDLEKWAVVACDQYTSQVEYWEELYRYVGESPSTLHLILPEVYLGAEDVEDRIIKIHQTMEDYLHSGILEELEGLIYIERVLEKGVRKGLLVALDLEKYDFRPSSNSIIRATEATIVERIPPRVKMRDGAAMELPHIMILIDDERKEVIEQIGEKRDSLAPLYNFPLNMGGGELRGFAIKEPIMEEKVLQSIERLADEDYFHKKNQLSAMGKPLIFAVGDGNHSMAAAKAYWDKIKSTVSPNHPARYALVELVNLYDEGLVFEPIHRLIMGVKVDLVKKAAQYFSDAVFEPCSNYQEVIARVMEDGGNFQPSCHCFGFMSEEKIGCLKVKDHSTSLAVAALQGFIDSGLQEKWFDKLDYVHGDNALATLAEKPTNAGFFLPIIDKTSLFKIVMVDGHLPNKAFSMGRAHEKRYYMEGRLIR